MIYFVAGAVALTGALLIIRVFVSADPTRLAASARQAAIALAALATGALVLLLISRIGIAPAIVIAAALSPLGYRAWRSWRTASGPAPGRVSEVETAYLRMHLDHDSGTMGGRVRRGRLRGADLKDLSWSELIALWHECRAEDEDGTRLLEAYLDRLAPDWRASSQDDRMGPAAAGDGMSEAEAYAILGLKEGAGDKEILEAHRRLMQKLHPDHGGSTWLAAKLNRAREVLLAS